MIALWLLDTDSFGIVPRRLLNLLDRGEEERARLLRPAEQRRFLISRIVLRQGLSSVIGGEPRSWRFIIGATGKVNLAHCYDNPSADFSISYAGNAVAIVVSTSGSVGVDLEEAAGGDSASARTVFPTAQFSEREGKYLGRLSGDEQWGETLKIWTQKEAYSKLLGLGLHMDFAQLDLLAGPPPDSGIEIETRQVSIAKRSYCLSLAMQKLEPSTVTIRKPNFLSCVSNELCPA